MCTRWFQICLHMENFQPTVAHVVLTAAIVVFARKRPAERGMRGMKGWILQKFNFLILILVSGGRKIRFFPRLCS